MPGLADQEKYDQKNHVQTSRPLSGYLSIACTRTDEPGRVAVTYR